MSFWRMIPRSVYLYVILADGTPQSVPQRAPNLMRFYMRRQPLFMLPCRVYLHFFLVIGTPQRVPQLATRFTTFIKCACLLFIEIVVYLVLANDTPQSVSTCYFGEWYPAECTTSLRVIFLILANDTP